MTRLATIAAAFPLHYQRIVEATVADDAGSGGKGLAWLHSDRLSQDAGSILALAFNWRQSTEGFAYWSALAIGSRQKHWHRKAA